MSRPSSPVRSAFPVFPAVLLGCLLALPLAAELPCLSLEVLGEAAGSDGLFADGFESGTAERWGSEAPTTATPVFHTRGTGDLELALGLGDGAAGEHLVEIRVLLPEGHLYQSTSIPVDATSTRTGASTAVRRVDGYPRPLEVQTPRARAGARRLSVSAILPVAGTSITTSSLHGTWTAEARVDGSESACATTTFVLVP